MFIEKEVISPGCYFYTDERGMPRKLEVDSNLTTYWHEQGQKMLSSGLTVPVPYEHDFDNGHPMTAKEKLLNNAGEVKEYRLRDFDDPIRGNVKNGLFAVVEVQDKELIEKNKIGSSIRWTSPWISSFTDGNGTQWNNVITHLALTTRPRITQQQPFPSIAAALSMAVDVSLASDQPRSDDGRFASTGRTNMVKKKQPTQEELTKKAHDRESQPDEGGEGFLKRLKRRQVKERTKRKKRTIREMKGDSSDDGEESARAKGKDLFAKQQVTKSNSIDKLRKSKKAARRRQKRSAEIDKKYGDDSLRQIGREKPLSTNGFSLSRAGLIHTHNNTPMPVYPMAFSIMSGVWMGFDESKHTRGEGGKFASTKGGGSNKPKKSVKKKDPHYKTKKLRQQVKKIREKRAKKYEEEDRNDAPLTAIERHRRHGDTPNMSGARLENIHREARDIIRKTQTPEGPEAHRRRIRDFEENQKVERRRRRGLKIEGEGPQSADDDKLSTKKRKGKKLSNEDQSFAFDDSKHTRDDGGRFASTAGGGKKKPLPRPNRKRQTNTRHRRAADRAREIDEHTGDKQNRKLTEAESKGNTSQQRNTDFAKKSTTAAEVDKAKKNVLQRTRKPKRTAKGNQKKVSDSASGRTNMAKKKKPTDRGNSGSIHAGFTMDNKKRRFDDEDDDDFNDYDDDDDDNDFDDEDDYDEDEFDDEDGDDNEFTDNDEDDDNIDLPPYGDPKGDIGMEELLCDLLQALGVPMPDESNPHEFKRHLYEATMSKIKELTSKGMGKDEFKPDQNQPPGQQPNASQPGQNPIIQQEQQPMYMSQESPMAALSLEDINKITDPTMRTIALSMYTENRSLQAKLEANEKTANGLRDAKLKEAEAQRKVRVMMLSRVSPLVKADLEAMLALPNMALSMGDGGVVVDPLAQTLAVLEKGLANLPRLLTTETSALSVHPQPTDNEMSSEEADDLSDKMSRMMGCPTEKKQAS